MKKTQSFYISDETDTMLDAMSQNTGVAKGRLIDFLVKDHCDVVREMKESSDKLHEKYIHMMAFRAE